MIEGVNVGLLETPGDMGSFEMVMFCLGGRTMEVGGTARVGMTEAVPVAVVLEIAVVAADDLLGPPGECVGDGVLLRDGSESEGSWDESNL